MIDSSPSRFPPSLSKDGRRPAIWCHKIVLWSEGRYEGRCPENQDKLLFILFIKKNSPRTSFLFFVFAKSGEVSGLEDKIPDQRWDGIFMGDVPC